MGGSDDKENLVNLTLQEHFLVHLLLYQIFKDTKPHLLFAAEKFYTDANPERIKWRKMHPRPKWMCKQISIQKEQLKLKVRSMYYDWLGGKSNYL